MCTYSSSKTHNLSRHLLTKLSNEDILNNKACIYCTYVAARPVHLRQHLKNVHGKNETKSLATQYKEYKGVSKNSNIISYLRKKIKTEKFNEGDVENMVSDCNASIRDILKVVKHMRKRFRQNSFTSNIRDKIRDKINLTEKYHESKKQMFKDKNGGEKISVLTKLKDVPTFIEHVIKTRNYDRNKIEVVFGVDGGHNKIIQTMSIIPNTERKIGQI